MSDVTHIGEFQLIRHAGRGAFADVWLGVHRIKAIEWLSSYLDIRPDVPGRGHSRGGAFGCRFTHPYRMILDFGD